MLFFQGVGTWIVIVNGGLNGIAEEVFEAAKIDGVNAWQLAWQIELPLIRPWIGYAALFNATVAAGLDVKLYMPQLALATVISMIPLLVVFIGAQRFLVRGQTVGAVKG